MQASEVAERLQRLADRIRSANPDSYIDKELGEGWASELEMLADELGASSERPGLSADAGGEVGDSASPSLPRDWKQEAPDEWPPAPGEEPT
jgi:hypothetical protein